MPNGTTGPRTGQAQRVRTLIGPCPRAPDSACTVAISTPSSAVSTSVPPNDAMQKRSDRISTRLERPRAIPGGDGSRIR